MKKNKLFSKLLSVISAVSIVFSGGIISNCVRAASFEDIVRSCLNGHLPSRGSALNRAQYDFIRSLGIGDSDFKERLKAGIDKELFEKCESLGTSDSVFFVLFIKLIDETPARIDKEKIMEVLVSNRIKGERRDDRLVAKIICGHLSSKWMHRTKGRR